MMTQKIYLIIFLLLFTCGRPEKNDPIQLDGAIFYEMAALNDARSLQANISQLKTYGVSVVCLNPIFSTAELKNLNPTLGDLTDFKNLVKSYHDSSIYVIVDFIAKGVAIENNLLAGHPEWFTNRDSTGAIFDYANKALRKYIVDLLKFWIQEAGIDGYRLRLADVTPIEFWQDLKNELLSIKPIIFISEVDDPQFVNTAIFDAVYTHLPDKIMEATFENEEEIETLVNYVNDHSSKNYLRSYVADQSIDSLEPLLQLNRDTEKFRNILNFTLPGFPLIFDGQVISENDFLEMLVSLYCQFNQATENSHFRRLKTDSDDRILAFIRQYDFEKILVVINFSNQAFDGFIETSGLSGFMQDIFQKINLNVSGSKTKMKLKPREYRIYIPAQLKIIKPRTKYIVLDKNH